MFEEIWLDNTHNFTSFSQAKVQIQKDIVILANDIAFQEVIEDDGVELLVSSRENISNEKPM